MQHYWVYIMSNQSRTLYTGVTNNLELRVAQHQAKVKSGSFTAKYNCGWLVYYDEFTQINDAIAAEKKVKGWTRAKKLALSDAKNPRFDDLSATWHMQCIPPTPGCHPEGA
jgi:putative endonuclease